MRSGMVRRAGGVNCVVLGVDDEEYIEMVQTSE